MNRVACSVRGGRRASPFSSFRPRTITYPSLIRILWLLTSGLRADGAPAGVRLGLVLGVPEFGHLFQRVFGSPWQHQASLSYFRKLIDRNRHPVSAHLQKAADVDNRIGKGGIRSDDKFLDLANLFVFLVVHRRPEELCYSVSAGNNPHLTDFDAENRATCDRHPSLSGLVLLLRMRGDG